MVVVMMRYAKGDQVEVMSTNWRLEDLWHPARIVGVHGGDMYIVRYEGHANGVMEERVLVKCVRPRPPLVKFENWSHGDLVHVFDNFAWKLAAVLEVLEKKRFLVRVVGSMKELKVGIAWIRVRHYWQDDRWIVIGKGPSNSDVKQPVFRQYRISGLLYEQRNTRKSTLQKLDTVKTKAVKRTASSTLDRMPAMRGLMKISRTAERTSRCTLNQNQSEACTENGMRSKVTEEHHEPATSSETQYMIHEDSGFTSIGSCSIVYNSSSHPDPTKLPDHLFDIDDDVSDANSCTGPES